MTAEINSSLKLEEREKRNLKEVENGEGVLSCVCKSGSKFFNFGGRFQIQVINYDLESKSVHSII